MIQNEEAKESMIYEEGVLVIKGRVCVPRFDDFTQVIFIEAYSSRYSIHPGEIKMYPDLT